MSTVQNVYDDVDSILLERSGFTLGLITQQQFLEYFAAVMQDFLGRTGLIRGVAVVPQEFGVPQYTLPDFTSQPDVCFSDGLALRRDAEGDIGTINRNWQNKVGTPRSWRQDKQYMSQVSLFPSPNVENPLAPAGPAPGEFGAVLGWAPGQSNTGQQAYIGTMTQSGGTATFSSPGAFFNGVTLSQFSRGNLCAVGPVGLMTQDVSLSSPIESLTDDWLHFIKYGILEKIWMSDSELKDIERARYAHARYEEGCMLAAGIMGEAIDSQ